MPTPSASKCSNSKLLLEPSSNARGAGFKLTLKRKRLLAATHDGKYSSKDHTLITPAELFDSASAFPAPLVLPDDDLDMDPEWPPQSVKEWHEEEERNPVTSKRKTIYLVVPPTITDEMAAMKDWVEPGSKAPTSRRPTEHSELKMADLQAYVAAFYYGMPVKVLKKSFSWHKWDAEGKQPYDGRRLKPKQEELIGLRTPGDTMIGVRCRLSPDKAAMQANLDDILDGLAENLPTDAYAIMMLLDLDMYEGDDDIFTGGRAYGGSRIAVVSSFRDNPMHEYSLTSLEHRWPASHCSAYVASLCGGGGQQQTTSNVEESGPIVRAVRSVAGLPQKLLTSKAMYVEWLSRISQTMTHELGHCFGLDHCVCYACVMQGCASSAEALRQPPYLCPVCLEKVATAIGGALVKDWNKLHVRQRYAAERYEAIMKGCQLRDEQEDSVFWVGYRVWLQEMMCSIGCQPTT